MNYLLFTNRKEKARKFAPWDFLTIREFSPNIWKLYPDFEKKHKRFRISLFRFYISVLTLGKTTIYYALNSSNEIVHSAYVIPPNFKYAFLKTNELCIGPCNTIERYRGQGIYPYILNYILFKNKNRDFCMIIRKENNASIRGVIKAGFIQDSKTVRGTSLLNRFVINQERNIERI